MVKATNVETKKKRFRTMTTNFDRNTLHPNEFYWVHVTKYVYAFRIDGERLRFMANLYFSFFLPILFFSQLMHIFRQLIFTWFSSPKELPLSFVNRKRKRNHLQRKFTHRTALWLHKCIWSHVVDHIIFYFHQNQQHAINWHHLYMNNNDNNYCDIGSTVVLNLFDNKWF